MTDYESWATDILDTVLSNADTVKTAGGVIIFNREEVEALIVKELKEGVDATCEACRAEAQYP